MSLQKTVSTVEYGELKIYRRHGEDCGEVAVRVPHVMTDEDVQELMGEIGFYKEYHGPGRYFANPFHWVRGRSTLIGLSFGLDV